MYQIFLDGNLIHDANIRDLKIYSPRVDLRQNEIGSFEFTIYPTNRYYNAINKLKSIVEVYQCGELIFRGRALEIETDIKQAKRIYFEELYGYLCDSVQIPFNLAPLRGTVKELFEEMIEAHNSQVEEEKRFKVGEVTVSFLSPYGFVDNETNYTTTWRFFKEKFIGYLGGYLRIRYEEDGNYLDYLKDFEEVNTQSVTFGENMLMVKYVGNGVDIATVLIPFGATLKDSDEKLTIESVNDGKNYIEHAENIEKYGRITKVVEFEEDDAEDLLYKAMQTLESMGKEIATIEISALDMASINKDISNFKMYSRIRVTSLYHGIDDYFLPLQMSINLFEPKNNKITLNGTIKTLTDVNKNEQQIIKNTIVKNKAEADSQYTYLYTKIENVEGGGEPIPLEDLEKIFV